MKIMCIGGGAAGLYFAILMKQRNMDHDITVIERNKQGNTFGWGVVFSDNTMENLYQHDAKTATQIHNALNRWEDISVYFKDKKITTTGHGFIGIYRGKLLEILQSRCVELGVHLEFSKNIDNIDQFMIQHQPDMVIASDGINSMVRNRFYETYQPDIDTRKCRFTWLGTHKLFNAFTFIFKKTEHGWFAVHAYRFNKDTSTFIVETPETCWQKSGIGQMSKEESITLCQNLFEEYLDGNTLLSNADHLRGSASWIKFPRIICKTWTHWYPAENKEIPIVLMGDSAHTAHYSIGSGTKLALEDAMDLSNMIKENDQKHLKKVLQNYENRRNVDVMKLQNAARNSMEWFENVDLYEHFSPEQFTYSLLTRSQRISHENLRLRDNHYIKNYEKYYGTCLPALSDRLIGNMLLKNRIIYAPLSLFEAEQDGMMKPIQHHTLMAMALGGCGLVMTEALAISALARSTHYSAGLWNEAQAEDLRTLCDRIHANTTAKIGAQLMHAGRKGSIHKPVGVTLAPLEQQWELLAPSAIPFRKDFAIPKAMEENDMQAIVQDFVEAAKRADKAGIDLLEIHAAHGTLLSSFISPLSNQRKDQYGGSLENRMRFPLEVIDALKSVWKKPLTVKISAHDWYEEGNTEEEAVSIAKCLYDHGVDALIVSSGGVVPNEQPIYGRMYQVPFANLIRNRTQKTVIAIGNIKTLDECNTIIAAGRADFCAIGRTLLINSNWLYQQANDIDPKQVIWPDYYERAFEQ